MDNEVSSSAVRLHYPCLVQIGAAPMVALVYSRFYLGRKVTGHLVCIRISYCTSGSRYRNYSTRPRERSSAVILRAKSAITYDQDFVIGPHAAHISNSVPIFECNLSIIMFQKNTTPSTAIGNLEINQNFVPVAFRTESSQRSTNAPINDVS